MGPRVSRGKVCGRALRAGQCMKPGTLKPPVVLAGAREARADVRRAAAAAVRAVPAAPRLADIAPPAPEHVPPHFEEADGDDETEEDELVLPRLPEYDDEDSLLASLSESPPRPSRLREVDELLRELRGSVEPMVPPLLA